MIKKANRVYVVSVRFSEEEYKILLKKSKEARRNKSDFIRVKSIY